MPAGPVLIPRLDGMLTAIAVELAPFAELEAWASIHEAAAAAGLELVGPREHLALASAPEAVRDALTGAGAPAGSMAGVAWAMACVPNRPS